MKQCRNFGLILFLIIVFIYGCNKNIEPVLIITHSEKILSFSKCFVIQGNDTLTDNLIPLDSTAEMQFIGTTGFKLVDGKAFVGASMSVADSTGAILYRNDDLFLDYDTIGFDPELVKERIGIFLETSYPMVKGGIYKWNAKIWDKKGNGEINAELLIKIKL